MEIEEFINIVNEIFNFKSHKETEQGFTFSFKLSSKSSRTVFLSKKEYLSIENKPFQKGFNFIYDKKLF